MKIKSIPVDAKQKVEDIIEEFNQKHFRESDCFYQARFKGNIFILTGVIMAIWALYAASLTQAVWIDGSSPYSSGAGKNMIRKSGYFLAVNM